MTSCSDMNKLNLCVASPLGRGMYNTWYWMTPNGGGGQATPAQIHELNQCIISPLDWVIQCTLCRVTPSGGGQTTQGSTQGSKLTNLSLETLSLVTHCLQMEGSELTTN